MAATSTASSSGAVATLNPVQLSIQTKNITSVSTYDLVAYNSTGTSVASYTGQYPRVTLDLPSGTYLFAATANGPAPSQPLVCCVCAQSGAATPATPPAVKTSSGSSVSPAIAYPCYYGNPPVEYGYSLAQVSGSTSLTITTQPPSSIPTVDVSVSVSFKNGTAAAGAYVSASAVGTDLNWGDNSNLSMYAQTAANGVAQLFVPAVPLTVTASDSVQVNLTKSQTTVQVDVGGQPVNVTLYYSPDYVYLSASALLLPPQTSLSMVLIAQTQPQLILYAVGSASPASAAASNSSPVQQAPQATVGVGAVSSGASTTTAQLAAIPPIPASDLGSPAPTQPSSNGSGATLLAIGTLALAGAIAAIVGIAISRTKR